MPRPKLDLFQQKPIAHHQQSLLFHLSDCEDLDAVYRRVSGLPHTGIILSEAQLVGHDQKLSSSPRLIEWPGPPEERANLKSFRSWLRYIQEYAACGVVLPIRLGGVDEMERRAETKRLLSELRKRKLMGMVEIQWEPVINPEVALWAFAVRVGMDIGADYTLLQLPSTANTKEIIHGSGGGNMIVCSAGDWQSQRDDMSIYVRRMVAGGAAGMCFSDQLVSMDGFATIARQVGDTLFGSDELPTKQERAMKRQS